MLPCHMLFHSTPLGYMRIIEQDNAITQVAFDNAPANPPPAGTPLLAEAARQLDAYFAGTLYTFQLPLCPAGTPFQRTVWAALCDIPYGETRTYAEIARAIGRPSACRAVGQANHRNPIAILIPCHRVIGANGTLTGYASGLERKQFLLQLEQRTYPSDGVVRE